MFPQGVKDSSAEHGSCAVGILIIADTTALVNMFKFSSHPEGFKPLTEFVVLQVSLPNKETRNTIMN